MLRKSWSPAHFQISALLEMCIYLERSSFESSSVVIFDLAQGNLVKKKNTILDSIGITSYFSLDTLRVE